MRVEYCSGRHGAILMNASEILEAGAHGRKEILRFVWLMSEDLTVRAATTSKCEKATM